MNLLFPESGAFARAGRGLTGLAAALYLVLVPVLAPAQGVGASTGFAGAAPVAVKPLFNQLGFMPSWSKQVFLASGERDNRPRSVSLLQAGSTAVLREISAGTAQQDSDSGDWLRMLDLGAQLGPGSYVIRAQGEELTQFEVNDGVYRSLQRALLRAFYLQRCGPALDDYETGLAHAACHSDDATLAHDDEINPKGHPMATTGGWHDAGDYGKYVATTAVAIGRILAAYERSPAQFASDATGIPESHNQVPDLLDEMRVGLDWMLSMQRADGAVYRKVGGTQWPKQLAPDDDRQARLVYGVSSPETAKAAAAWAQAARIYLHIDPAQSALYLAAAYRSWRWLVTLKQPQRIDIQAGDDSGSGPYRSNDIDSEASLQYDWDDRLWAATELYLSTGKDEFLQVLRDLLPHAPLNLYEWKDPSALAMSYLLWHPGLHDQTALANAVRPLFLQRAKALNVRMKLSGWRIANQNFVWGSNKMTVEEGIMLCRAYEIGGNPDYLAAARDQLHYVLGRNHFGKSFVSGIGSDAVREPSHLWFQARRQPIPGLFVGGPNKNEQSQIAPRDLGLLSWADDTRSYATNEFAIDYNASLLGLLAELDTDCYTRSGAP
jgi:endoglucanase